MAGLRSVLARSLDVMRPVVPAGLGPGSTLRDVVEPDGPKLDALGGLSSPGTFWRSEVSTPPAACAGRGRGGRLKAPA